MKRYRDSLFMDCYISLIVALGVTVATFVFGFKFYGGWLATTPEWLWQPAVILGIGSFICTLIIRRW